MSSNRRIGNEAGEELLPFVYDAGIGLGAF